MAKNVLYYGDNLDILQRYIRDETVGLLKNSIESAKIDRCAAFFAVVVTVSCLRLSF